jgi:hypothetical protein
MRLSATRPHLKDQVFRQASYHKDSCGGNHICYNQTALKPRRYEWPPQPSLK